jgi:hypothetical protein
MSEEITNVAAPETTTMQNVYSFFTSMLPAEPIDFSELIHHLIHNLAIPAVLLFIGVYTIDKLWKYAMTLRVQG